MKRYEVFRSYVTEESCIVEASNKKEAINKAKKEEFAKDKYEEKLGWYHQTVVKFFKSYVVKERMKELPNSWGYGA